MLLLDAENSPLLGFLLIIGVLALYLFKPIIMERLANGGRSTSVFTNNKPGTVHTYYQLEEIKELNRYLELLTKSYDVQNSIDDRNLRTYFNERNYCNCVQEIMKKMGLNNKVKVVCYPDYKYPDKNSNAYVTIPGNIPLLNTIAFNRCRIEVTIRKSITGRYETFVYVIAHELSHIVLHGMKNPLRESEVATDLFVMIRGFSEIMKKGIHENHVNGIYAEDGFTKITDSHSSINGYLGIEKFTVAYEYLKRIDRKQKPEQTNPIKNPISSKGPPRTMPITPIPETIGKEVTLIQSRKTGKMYAPTTNGQSFRVQVKGLVESWNNGVMRQVSRTGWAWFENEEAAIQFVASAVNGVAQGKVVYKDQLEPIGTESNEFGIQIPYLMHLNGVELTVEQRLAIQKAAFSRGVTWSKNGMPIYRQKIYSSDVNEPDVILSPDNTDDVLTFAARVLDGLQSNKAVKEARLIELKSIAKKDRTPEEKTELLQLMAELEG